MKKLSTFLLMLITVVMACSKSEDESWVWSEDTPVYDWPEGQKYYYAFDEKIYLYEVPNEVVLCYDKKYFSDILKTLQKNVQIQSIELLNGFNIFILKTAEYYKIDVLKKDFSKQKGVKSINPMYKNNVITDEILVQFKDSVSKYSINEIHKKYGVTVKKTTELYQLLSVPFILDPLEVANAYQESGLVVYSCPNFIAKMNLGIILNSLNMKHLLTLN